MSFRAGSGFIPNIATPLGTDAAQKPSQNGRGILLMSTFMDEVNFDFEGNRGTAVTLRKRLKATDPKEKKEDLG